MAVGDNATVVSQQSSGKVVDGDGQKELKNKNHGGSQTQTNYDVSVGKLLILEDTGNYRQTGLTVSCVVYSSHSMFKITVLAGRHPNRILV